MSDDEFADPADVERTRELVRRVLEPGRARMVGGTEPTCPACFGTGIVTDFQCVLCGGSGVREVSAGDPSSRAGATPQGPAGDRSPVELFEAGTEPPDDPRRTCRRCGKTPMRGSWWCVFHQDKQSTELEPQMRAQSLRRWRQYWEGATPPSPRPFDGPA